MSGSGGNNPDGEDAEGSRSSGEVAWEWRSRIASGMAVMQRDIGALVKAVDKLGTDIQQTYATKADLKTLADRLDKVDTNIGWAVKLVLGLVVIAVVGAIITKVPVR